MHGVVLLCLYYLENFVPQDCRSLAAEPEIHVTERKSRRNMSALELSMTEFPPIPIVISAYWVPSRFGAFYFLPSVPWASCIESHMGLVHRRISLLPVLGTAGKYLPLSFSSVLCRANTRGRAERILTLGFSLFPTRSLITSTSINPLMKIGDL